MWYTYVPGRNGLLRPFPRIWPFRRRHGLGYQQIPLANRNAPQVAYETQHAVPPARVVRYPAPLEDEEHLVEVNVSPVALAAARGIVQPTPRRTVERPRPPHPYLPEFPPRDPTPAIAAVVPRLRIKARPN